MIIKKQKKKVQLQLSTPTCNNSPFKNYCEYFDIDVGSLDEQELKQTKRAAREFYNEAKMKKPC